MSHVMIDLETLDTKPSTKILSLGAVIFDPENGELGETFYRKLNSDLQLSRTESKSTMNCFRSDFLSKMKCYTVLFQRTKLLPIMMVLYLNKSTKQ